MDNDYMVPQIKKLLKNFVFDEFDIKFDVELINFYHLDDLYKITVYLDPEVVCMSGDRYNPKSDDFLYKLEDNIEGALKYVGLDESTNVSIKYKFLNEKEFSKKLYNMFMEVLPKIYKEDNTLPKLIGAVAHQRGSMNEFVLNLNFHETYNSNPNYQEQMYDLIHHFLPTFSDVYIKFD
jgi:hypothetical protein